MNISKQLLEAANLNPTKNSRQEWGCRFND